MAGGDEAMLAFAGIDNDPLFIISDQNHEMILLIDPESLINQENERIARINIPFQIL